MKSKPNNSTEYHFQEYTVTLSGDEQAAIATIHIQAFVEGNPGYDMGQLILRGRAVEVLPFTSAGKGKRGILQKFTFKTLSNELTDYVAQCPATMDSQTIMAEFWGKKQRDFREQQRRREVKQQMHEADAGRRNK